MPDELRQFRILWRAFLFRALDLQLLSPGSDLARLMVQLAALLAGFNFVVAVMIVPRYGTSALPRATLLVNAWGDEEFLIATTMTVVGLFMVLAWDTLLPDLRDSLVLGALPVRTRTIAMAKAAALVCALALIVLLVNIFTGFCYAMIAAVSGNGIGLLRTLAAYWITMAAAALFTAFLLLAIQGLAAQLLSYRVFLRVSSFLQLAAFFAIIAVYFLKPPLATPSRLTAPQNEVWLAWLPSYWFLGVFHELNGTTHPVFAKLAAYAMWGLLAFGLLATLTFALAYRRTVQRMVEQPDIFSADRSRPTSHAGAAIAKLWFEAPWERAIFLFVARTLARSRQHRLLLALYGGISFAIALAYLESLLHGGWQQTWKQPNVPLLVASLVILFFAILGARIVFAFPLALPSNWIFRVSAVQSPKDYFAAIRKSLYALTALPIWIASAAFFFAVWPSLAALQHMLVMVLVGVLIAEKSVYAFRKFPFACSYLPGKANLNVRLPFYGGLGLFVAHQGGLLEFWAMQRPARYLALILFLAVAAIWARRRFHEFATAPSSTLQFEDLPPREVFRINLRQDGETFS